MTLSLTIKMDLALNEGDEQNRAPPKPGPPRQNMGVPYDFCSLGRFLLAGFAHRPTSNFDYHPTCLHVKDGCNSESFDLFSIYFFQILAQYTPFCSISLTADTTSLNRKIFETLPAAK